MIFKLLIMLTIATSCSSSKQNEQRVIDFYNRAKQYESDLSILFGVSFTARGFKDDKPFIPRIEVAVDEKETITLPGITKGMTDEEIREIPFFENIEVYSNRMGFPDSTAYQNVKGYLITITELAHELKSYKVQSTPRLGKFIIFTLTHEDEVIYVLDLNDVKYDNWKEFFSSGKKLGDNWYYRNTKSN